MMNRFTFRPTSMVTCKGNNSANKLYIQEEDGEVNKQLEDAIGEHHESAQKRARHLRGSAMDRGLGEVPCRHRHKAAAHHSALDVTRPNYAKATAVQALHEANLRHRT